MKRVRFGALVVVAVLVLAPGLRAQSRTLVAGQHNLTLTTSVTLTTTGLSVVEVYIQNDPNSAKNILVGDATLQTIMLTPGSGITIAIDNLSAVYVKLASAGTAIVNWLARTN